MFLFLIPPQDGYFELVTQRLNGVSLVSSAGSFQRPSPQRLLCRHKQTCPVLSLSPEPLNAERLLQLSPHVLGNRRLQGVTAASTHAAAKPLAANTSRKKATKECVVSQGPMQITGRTVGFRAHESPLRFSPLYRIGLASSVDCTNSMYGVTSTTHLIYGVYQQVAACFLRTRRPPQRSS